MLARPMKRICPSLICVARSNTARQRGGLRNGSRPSTTSISAKAPTRYSQNVAPVTAGYFFPAAGGAGLGVGAPRIALKNSLLGSTTITSERLRKVARYASRLR